VGTSQSESPPVPAATSRPIVVALIGLPGSGKSVAAQALSEQLGLRRIDRDAIRDAMFPQCTFSFAEKRAAFRALLLALEINCVLGVSSVIEGVTFGSRRDLLRVDTVVRRYGFMPIPVYLDCAVEVAQARITQQLAANPALARTPELAAEVRARFETPPPNALAVNANRPLDEVARVVVAAVAQVRAA
jgi:adenylylsulfate kinase-like enzyme